jgi:DNA-directed RNA polymerase beta' subunit
MKSSSASQCAASGGRCGKNKVVYSAPSDKLVIERKVGAAKNAATTIISPDEVFVKFLELRTDEMRLLGFPGSNSSEILPGNDFPANRPQDLLMFGIKVLPTRQRMPVRTKGGRFETSEFTNSYSDIIRRANDLLEFTRKTSSLDRNQYNQTVATKKNSLTEAVKDFFKSSSNSGNNRKQGLFALINGKHGMFRELFNAARTNFCARTVIGPGPELAADEIGLPQEWASVLTYPEQIFRTVDFNSKIVSNLDEMIELLRIGQIETFTRDGSEYSVNPDDRMRTELHIGDIVHRHLRDGDIVAANRYPTLHKGSFMGMKVKFHEGRNIRLPLPVTGPFNADNDGDEMQVHAPQSIIAAVELRQLMDISHCIRSDARGEIQIGLAYDGPEGSYFLTKPGTRLSKDQLFDAISRIKTPVDINELIRRCQVLNSPINPYEKVVENGKTVWKFKGWFSGRFLVSLLLPPSFSAIINFPEDGYQKDFDVDGRPVVEKRCLIRKGLLEEGTLTAELIGNKRGLLLLALIKQETEEIAIRLISDLTFLTDWYLATIGFSLAYDDCVRPELQGMVHRRMVEETKNAENQIEKLGPRPSTSLELARWEETVLQIMRDIPLKSMKELLPYFEGTPLLSMIESGAKGNKSNVKDITGEVGPASVMGKMIPSRYYGRPSPFFPKGDVSLASMGYCKGNFGSGLNPTGMANNATETRANILSGKNVQESGYAERKMAKQMENVQTQYDGSVRDNGLKMVADTWGELNLNTSETLRVRDEYGTFYSGVDVPNLALRVNMMFNAVPEPRPKRKGKGKEKASL